MKTVKPMRLGVLTRPYEDARKSYLSVAVTAFFPFDQPDRLLPDASMWKLVATELGPNAILDECMPKPAAEVLLAAHAYPARPPQPACQVRVRIGSVDRRLYVFGDRRWKLTGPTDAAPFTSKPLTWAEAFGGEGYAKNPAGKGFKPVRDESGETHPLPNVEEPDAFVVSPGDRPEPAGLGPLDMAWPQRMSKAGTYDEAWMKERYPGFPADFEASFFNVASPAQRLSGFLQPGERFTLENMHPEEPVLEGSLPTGAARCFLNFKAAPDLELVEVPLRIDTVWLIPHQKRGIVFYRGVAPVREDDAADVLHLVAAYEARGAPRDVEHYTRVLMERLDTKNALAATMRERDLVPEMPAPKGHPDEQVSDMDQLLATDRLVLENARRGGERQLAEARAEIEARLAEGGVGAREELDAIPERLPDLAAVPTLDELPELFESSLKQAEVARAEAEARVAETLAKVRAECAAAGLDYDKMVATEKDRALRRSRLFSAKREIENMETTAELFEKAGLDASTERGALADPALVEKLLKVEAQVNDTYHRIAHHLEATLAEGEALSGEELVAGAREGRSFVGRDLTNAKLEGLDLTGIDLEGAFLEGAKLNGATLTRANLRRAVLTRADLSGAKLDGADLTHANLGGATLHDADFTGAKLERAVLAKAAFKGARFVGARLSGADLSQTTVEGANLDSADLAGSMVYEGSFEGVSMRGADLTKAVFVQGRFREVTLEGAACVAAVFMTVDGEGARFDGANLKSARFIGDARFPASSFRGADLTSANLRGTALTGADFTDADLTDADLSSTKLDGAKLTRVKARGARFVRADLARADLGQAILIETIFQKAHVEGASFEGANLFRADALRMVGDDATRMKGAFVKRVRVLPEGSHG